MISAIGSGTSPSAPSAPDTSQLEQALKSLQQQLQQLKATPKKSAEEQKAAEKQKANLEKQIANLEKQIQNASKNSTGNTASDNAMQKIKAAEASNHKNASNALTNKDRLDERQANQLNAPHEGIGETINMYV